MIKELNGHITQKQINIVVDKIKQQYTNYLNLINSSLFKSIFAPEYAPTRKKHSISWAISSAFPSGNTFSKLNVKRLEYGWFKLARPEIYNEKIVFHIIHDLNSRKPKYLKKYFSMNNSFDNDKIYFYINYKIDKNDLIIIEICLPDSTGKVIKREVII